MDRVGIDENEIRRAGAVPQYFYDWVDFNVCENSGNF